VKEGTTEEGFMDTSEHSQEKYVLGDGKSRALIRGRITRPNTTGTRKTGRKVETHRIENCAYLNPELEADHPYKKLHPRAGREFW